jgi:hypothetical protein
MGSGEAAFDLQVFLSEDWLLSFLVAPGIATSYATLL